MATIKVTLRNLRSIGDIFLAMLKLIESTGTKQDLHLVFNAPLEYVDLLMKSPIPVHIDYFWSCSNNKENIEVVSREFFKKTLPNYRTVISGYDYITDANGVKVFVEINNEQVSIQSELNSNMEEEDIPVIPHVTATVKDGSKRVMVPSDDADVVMLLLYFFNVYSEMDVEGLWVTFWKGESYRVIPIHSLFAKLGKQMCKILPIVHTAKSQI